MRILLKLSWEALAWTWVNAYDTNTLDLFVQNIKDLINEWIEISIFIWWGNIFRWVDWNILWIDKVSCDYMWMLATVMNWIALSEYLEKNWVSSKLLTSTSIDCIWERFEKKKAINYLKNKNVLVFAWGMWSPYFTTDTWWVLKALETNSDMIIKLTMVDWIYDKDPKKFSDAIMYKIVTYDEVLEKRLKVMDSSAIALARDNNLVLKVVNLSKPWAIKKAILTQEEWTTVVL